MCHRISPLFAEELQQALDNLEATGHAHVTHRTNKPNAPDVYPGKQMPLFVVGTSGKLEPAILTWGFDTTIGNRSKQVFNTRMDTALKQYSSGRGLWAGPISRGRCLVPVRGFYESWTKSQEHQRTDVRFTMPNRRIFLLAGICNSQRFSIVTTEPNSDVGYYHTRMPLVLAPGESGIWLGPDFASLANRPSPHLDAEPEL